ncbi:helix-turn-helix domain-containing protein, partial [Pedobacter sp. JCM 36344]|uniref:helix-turn-helix domain-containing protein n=1 Tax=Pedobacter sp. JCM 36344 TaxID=3374280 RepID=UPI00397CC413
DVQPKQWLRSSEVRKLLKISSGTLQNIRIKGILPYEKIGGILYYAYADIVQLLGEIGHS